MELRTVDPRKLKANPNNPRRSKASAAEDAQLAASVRAIGLIQPPLVQEDGKKLVIVAGHRRVAAAVAAGLAAIPVLVQEQVDGQLDPMRSFSENLVRTPMGPVDNWRATEALVAAGWTEAAIAGALGMTERAIAQLRLLARILPAMLDQMAGGDMPDGRMLRSIAAASQEEQAEVWKAHKPKRGRNALWHDIARALEKHRFFARDASFGPDEQAAFGIEWEQDLFAPADEDSRSTTRADAFIGAQQAWLEANLPPNATVVPIDEGGRLQLPRGARECWSSQPREGDLVATAVDPRSGKIRRAVYELPQRVSGSGGKDEGPGPRIAAVRPAVTQKGQAMIGDLRTEALHRVLGEQPIGDDQLIGLLVLALAGQNVDVRTGQRSDLADLRPRSRLAGALIEGGVLTRDPLLLRGAARAMLAHVLSCRENHSNSGVAARIAGAAVGADAFLPSMATEEFLPCLSKAAVTAAAEAEGVTPGARAKDTRAALIACFTGTTYVYPGARFALTDGELTARTGSGAPELDEEAGDDGESSFDPARDEYGNAPDEHSQAGDGAFAPAAGDGDGIRAAA